MSGACTTGGMGQGELSNWHAIRQASEAVLFGAALSRASPR